MHAIEWNVSRVPEDTE